MGLSEDFAAYRQRLLQAAVAGLDAAAPGVEDAAEAKAHAVIKGQTGATFAGIYAVVDGVGVDSSAQVAVAVAAVEERNPAHVYTEAAPAVPAGVVRLLGSVPTDYIDLIENTGKAFLYKALDDQERAIAAAVDGAVGKAT